MAPWGAGAWSPHPHLSPSSAVLQDKPGVKPLIGRWKESFGGAWRPLVVLSETALLRLKPSTFPWRLCKRLEQVLDVWVALYMQMGEDYQY